MVLEAVADATNCIACQAGGYTLSEDSNGGQCLADSVAKGHISGVKLETGHYEGDCPRCDTGPNTFGRLGNVCQCPTRYHTRIWRSKNVRFDEGLQKRDDTSSNSNIHSRSEFCEFIQCYTGLLADRE